MHQKMTNKIVILLLFCSLGLSAQWKKIASGTTKNINAVTYATNTNIIAVGDSGLILRSQNTGTTFSIIASGTFKNLNDVVFIDNSKGFIVGDGGTILKTLNGGLTWSQVTSNTNFDLNSIDFSGTNAIAVGSNGTILKSTNSGTSWTAQTPFTIYLFSKVHFATANVAVISGSNGLLIRSKDAGDNWTIMNSSANKSLSDFAFYPNSTSMIFVGNAGLKMACDTSFVSISESTISNQWLNAIHHINNSDTCFAVGKNATILYSIKGGSFQNVTSIVTEDLNDIVFVNDTTGFIVGTKGAIYKTLSGGIFSATKEIEKISFSLYPNPSKSFFTLNGIDKLGEDVQLKIFNVSGQLMYETKLVNTLIDHQLPSGIYYLVVSSSNKIGSTTFIVE